MIEPIKVTLTTQAETALKRHLKDRIMALSDGLKPLFETNLPMWRRMYEAQPLEKVRDFPWHGSSNLIVPIIAIHSDTLLARVMAGVHKVRPLWLAQIVGHADAEGDEIREAWETYLQYVGIEPDELDMYRVEEEWFGETIRYGTSTLKIPHVVETEDAIIAGDGLGTTPSFVKDTKYRGPRPEKLEFHKFLIEPGAKTLAKSDIKIHIRTLQKWELMERRFSNVYDAAKVDSILGQPDRTSPDFVQQQRETDANARTSSTYGYAEWDIYECWLAWRAPNQKYAPRITVWYHKNSDTILKAFYDQYPICPFIGARLLYRDDSYHGYGFCEVLAPFQEEVSEIHNERRDNSTVANTRVWRVDPNSKLHQGYSIYPSAMLPAVAGEIEALDPGAISAMVIDEERLTLDLAERRSGVSPPMQGYGAGTNTKRGVYTAMGTLSLLQEGNRRTDLTIADMRYAHQQAGRVISAIYSYFGLDETKLAAFGAMGQRIKAATQLIKEGKLILPIYSPTASVNREVEKQNDLLLTQVMARHYGMIGQLIQQTQNSTLPDPLKKYCAAVIEASDRLMKRILRHFDHEDVDSLIPAVELGGPNAAGGRRNLSVVPPAQLGAAVAPNPGGGPVQGVPPGLAGAGRPGLT